MPPPLQCLLCLYLVTGNLRIRMVTNAERIGHKFDIIFDAILIVTILILYHYLVSGDLNTPIWRQTDKRSHKISTLSIRCNHFQMVINATIKYTMNLSVPFEDNLKQDWERSLGHFHMVLT